MLKNELCIRQGSPMVYRFRQIDIWSVSRIVFVVFLLIGIILGLIYLMVMGLIANLLANLGDTDFAEGFFQLSGGMSVLGIFLLSIINAFFWSVLSALLLIIFNIMGGIKVVIEPETIGTSTVSPSSSSNVMLPPSFEGRSTS